MKLVFVESLLCLGFWAFAIGYTLLVAADFFWRLVDGHVWNLRGGWIGSVLMRVKSQTHGDEVSFDLVAERISANMQKGGTKEEKSYRKGELLSFFNDIPVRESLPTALLLVSQSWR